MKNKSSLSITFLFLALIFASAGIILLFYFGGEAAFYDVPFYILAGVDVLLIIAIIIAIGNYRNNKYIQTLENRLSLWNTISYKVKGAGETAFNNFPTGVVVLDNAYNIKWSNPTAQGILISSLKDRSLKEIANGKLYEFIIENENNSENVIISQIGLFQKTYLIQFIKDLRIIYLRDITEMVTLEKKYIDRTLAFGYINVDNLEAALSDLDVQGKSDYQGKIMNSIVKWAENFGAIVRAYSDSKLMLMTDHEHLKLMMENDFTILDDVKLLLKTTRAVYVTLSMGIVCEDLPIYKLTKEAEAQLELAFNRGGDQAIVKIDGKTTFYGAKTEPARRESKTEIRFEYQKMEAIMKAANTIFCMGHKFQDADSFASTIAMYNLAVGLGKQVYIIIDESSIDATVKRVYEDVKRYHHTLHRLFISPEKAMELANDRSLLIVVDCQAEDQLFIDKKQLLKFKHIGVIDHHRKNDSGTINNPDFYVSEPGASSCVEVIFSLLEFSEVELSISDNEATWMLLGMVVDTNNFVYRSTEVTFEIASKLAKMQANMGKVKEYLKEKKEEKLFRNRLITDVEVYRDNVAIAVQSDMVEVEKQALAKVSDELLSIEGFILSVTCGYLKGGKIGLSARSLGQVNCQVLMEKLGGGGHLTAAATQIAKEKMPEVIKKLKLAINEVLKIEKKVKVIFTVDVKGKGLKGEIVEFEAAQANLLIENNQAIPASTENIRLLEQEKREAQEAAAQEIKGLYAIKKQIESKPINIPVEIDQHGRIMDVVNTKVIANYLKKIINQKVDYRKIIFNSNVVALGEYEAELQLNKDIFATVIIYIVEKNKDDKNKDDKNKKNKNDANKVEKNETQNIDDKK